MVGVILVSSSRPSTRCSCFAWPSWTSSRLPPPPSPRAWESPAVRRRAWVSPAAPEDGTLVGESLQKWRLYEIMTQCFLSIGQNSTAKLSAAVVVGFALFKECKSSPKKEQKQEFLPQIKNVLLYFYWSKTCNSLQICSSDPSSPVEFKKSNVAK